MHLKVSKYLLLKLMNNLYMSFKVFYTSTLLSAHITVGESSFMNSPFMISKVPLEIIILVAYITVKYENYK